MTPTHKPLTALHVRPAIETSLFDFFKIGPGPSSSHTIGPMRAGHDFVQRCDALDPDLVRRAARIHVVLLGSLSATGMGHGTNTAVLAGLLRTSPETCPAGLLDKLGREADARHDAAHPRRPFAGGPCGHRTRPHHPRRPLQQHPARQP